FIKLRSNLVFPIDKLSFRQAVMIEPTACACHGMEVLAMKPGSNVLLMGAGPTGQVVGQMLKLNGASRLTVEAPAGPKLQATCNENKILAGTSSGNYTRTRVAA